MEKDRPFNKWCCKNWTAICKRIKLDHSHIMHKNKFKTDYLSVRPEIIKLLEENTGSMLFDISLSNMFLGSVSSGKGNKSKNKWDLIKLKRFCTAKETTDKMKR